MFETLARGASSVWTAGSDAKQLAVGLARTAQARVTHFGHRPDDVVVVAGSPRSGTTWLAELIDHDGRFRYCFEPLERHHRSRHFERLHRLHYGRLGSDDQVLTDALERLVTGQVFTPYSDQWDPHPSWFRRDQLLVKCTRANLLLGAIAEHHPHAHLVLIIRHPLSLISSRARLHRSDWATDEEDLADLLAQDDLVADFLEPHLGTIEKAKDPFRRQLVMWSIEQLVPLTQLTAAQAHVVAYEPLLTNTGGELPLVFRHIGAGDVPDLGDRISQPSRTSWNGQSFARSPREHATAWRNRFTDEELRLTDEILDGFGIFDLLAEWSIDGYETQTIDLAEPVIDDPRPRGTAAPAGRPALP